MFFIVSIYIINYNNYDSKVHLQVAPKTGYHFWSHTVTCELFFLTFFMFGLGEL